MTTSAAIPPAQPSKKPFVKVLAESSALNSIPSHYAQFNYFNDPIVSDSEVSIPVIDFSLLTSSDPDQRIKVIHDLGKACQDWGFFMVVNHGIPETLMKKMIDACDEFFTLAEEEKLKFQTKHVMDPITCGSTNNNSQEQVFFWRDFLKVFVHPDFHSPHNPKAFRDLLFEYSQRTREVARKLFQGISQSLGLEENYMDKSLDLDSGLQIFAANCYPRCPQPELAIGLPPHTDHGLLTLLVQNEVGGLQILHNGKWVNINPLPNSILVNTADHLEIFSNGKYKSVFHRAVLNNKKTRISLAVPHGPSLDAIVRPAPALLEKEGSLLAYTAMKYKEYMEMQQVTRHGGKSCLERSKIL